MGTREQVLAWGEKPQEERQPRTQKELAYILGVSEERISQILSKRKLKKPQRDISEIHSLNDYLLYIKELAYNPKSLGKDRELYAKLLGWLTEKREETHKIELNAIDYARIGRETINGLREEYQKLGGSCPLCGQRKLLRHEVRLDTEPEQQENREVATLALPSRPE